MTLTQLLDATAELLNDGSIEMRHVLFAIAFPECVRLSDNELTHRHAEYLAAHINIRRQMWPPLPTHGTGFVQWRKRK